MKMIVLLLLISQHASGVEVYEGAESVLLPCQVSVDVSRSSTSAGWDREDLSNPTVHLRLQKRDSLDERDDLSGQNYIYQHRTSMRVDALQTGDLSLTLRNPTASDSGTYTCTSRRAGEDQSKTEVHLKVSEPPPPPPVWPKVVTAVLVILIILIILAAAIGLFVYRAYKRMKDREVPQPEVVNVTDADESVLLPFTATADLPQDVTVEWTLTEPKPMKVHVYESGNNQPDKQDQGYRGRTEMDEDPLRNKDLSLTLKYPHLTDSGVYTCTVYNKDGHMLLQKSVILSVRESVPDIKQVPNGPGSVQLPFKTTAVLPQDVTVEWRDPNNMKVHVYESGKHQLGKQDQGYRDRTEMKEDPLRTKDLSLTLKDLHLTDSGVYTCTVFNKDGHMLLQKSVTLHVYETVRSLGTVYGNKSYLLEFEKTDKLDQISTVEWKRIYPKYKFIKEITRHQGNEDLSLNLEDLHLTDSGIYTCSAYDHNGDILLQQSVIFSVRDFQLEKVEVTEGEESVLLPFKTTADLHHVLRVYWSVSEPKNMMVDYFDVTKKNQPGLQDEHYRGRTEMNKDPLGTGDLSLTLKKPRLTDSRSYTCMVSNKDGRVLLQKVVILSVRATLKGTMADMLPCLRRRTAPKPEVKEESRDRHHEDLPLMEVHSA